MRNRFVIASLLVLAACATPQTPGTVKGTCDIVRTPEYAVKGRTGYDAAWINRTTEALVDGCGQPRPKARPPEFDAPKAKPAAKPKAKPKKKVERRWLPWPKPKPKLPEVQS